MPIIPVPITLIKNYDPFHTWLVRKLHLSPFKFGLLVFTLNFFVDVVLAWRYNLWWDLSGKVGLFQDYTAIITDFVYTPIICGLYIWCTAGSTQVFQQLMDSHVFKSESNPKNIVEQSRIQFSKSYVFFTILILSLFFAISQLAAYMGWLSWKAAGGWIELMPAISYARFPFWALMFYSFLYTIFNVSLTIMTLRKVFMSTDIQLIPLHPDHCGGLGAISNYLNKLALGIGSIGLLISAAAIFEVVNNSIFHAYPVLIGVIAYMLLAPIFFFLPLGSAHEAMKKARDAELLLLATQHKEGYDRLKQSLNERNFGYEELSKKLGNLERLYKVAESSPTWPFSFPSLRRFTAVVTAPLLPAIISILSDLIKRTFFE